MLRFLLTVFAMVSACAAQTPALLSFEVASVRPAADKPPGPMPAAGKMTGGPGTDDPQRMTFTWTLMRRLLMTAFDVPLDQLSGSDWVMGQDARFDIAVTLPAGTTKEQANTMLLNLLKERFHFAYHREKKDFDVYSLVVAKGGSKLKDAELSDGPPPASPEPGTRAHAAPQDRDGFPILPAGRPAGQGRFDNGMAYITFRMETPQDLLGMLQLDLRPGRSVDKTGLTGKYDFKLMYLSATLLGMSRGGVASPAGEINLADPAPDLFTAVEKQLGLKLEKSKEQLDVIVADHMDRQPTVN